MNEVVYNERYIVSALSRGTLFLRAFLSPIEARRHAENLAAETRYDDVPRYERVKIIDEKSGLRLPVAVTTESGLPVEVLGYSAE